MLLHKAQKPVHWLGTRWPMLPLVSQEVEKHPVPPGRGPGPLLKGERALYKAVDLAVTEHREAWAARVA
jgi:hypothetical protein